jgi:hypothetical protein
VTNYTDAHILYPYWITAGSDGALWFTSSNNNSIGRITTAVTPKIIRFAPQSGPVGTTVTITGQNLVGTTQVAFNGTTATIVSHTASKIVTTVPGGATTGPITVTARAGTAISPSPFGVT